jgi:hypothetical protein
VLLQQNGTSTCCHTSSASAAELPRHSVQHHSVHGWMKCGAHTRPWRALSGGSWRFILPCTSSYAAPLVATSLQKLTWQGLSSLELPEAHPDSSSQALNGAVIQFGVV